MSSIARKSIDARSQDKRRGLLGMPIGTASARLRKDILFSFVVRMGEDTCFRCLKKIETVGELSIEHKEAWMSAPDPLLSFFDLSNISFSHNLCNIAAGREPNKKWDSKQQMEAAKRASPKGKARIMRWRAKRSEKRRLHREKHRPCSTMDVQVGPNDEGAGSNPAMVAK